MKAVFMKIESDSIGSEKVLSFYSTFPFNIICDNSVESWQNIDLIFDNRKHTVYHPFRTQPANQTFSAAAILNKSPAFIQRNINPEKNLKRLMVYSNLNCDSQGLSSATNVLEDVPISKMSIAPCDSIHQDIAVLLEEDSVNYTTLQNRALSKIRKSTGQWWIGRFNFSEDSHLKISYAVDSNYNLLQEPAYNAKMIAASYWQRPLNESLWSWCWNDDRDVSFPDSYDKFLDANFQISMSENADAAISLAIAVEILKKELYIALNIENKINKKNMKQAIAASSNPLFYFNRYLASNGFSNFSVNNPEYNEIIDKIWTVRGYVAHGKHEYLEAYQDSAWQALKVEPYKMLNAVAALFYFAADLLEDRNRIPFIRFTSLK